MRDNAKFISAMLIFGTIGVFVKNIDLSSLEIAFLRAVIGCAFLLCAGIFMRQKISFIKIKKNSWLLLLSGAAIGFNWILLFQAFKHTSIANATLSYYFAPVLVMILSPVVLKERLTMAKMGCVIAAIAGLFMMLSNENASSMASANHLMGIIYGLSAAALYASVILMNKFIKELSGFETTLIQLSISALVLLPSIIFNQGIPGYAEDTRTFIFILVVGIIHTGLAYLMYFTSMKEIKGQTIAILSYIDPITAVIISAIFLGEDMTFWQIIGGALILGATFFSETGERVIKRVTDSI